MDHAPALSAVEAMERMAAEAEAVGDRSAPWLRALALSLEAAKQRDTAVAAAGISPGAEADLVARVSTSAAVATRNEMGQIGREMKARTWAIIGATLLGAVVLGFSSGAWWMSDRDQSKLNAAAYMMIEARDALPAMPAADRALWLEIIGANPNARELYRLCQSLPQPHGSACALPIWTRRPAEGQTPATH